MTSVSEEQKSPSKILQNGNQQISKVQFHLDDSRHIDDNHELLDEFHEYSPYSNNNSSSSSMNSTTNGTTLPKTLLNNENRLMTKRSIR
ncbi:unnamed protein product [Rotaria sp. Silwood1]|nr:unnamed protein product [Rotaria sp. Silwood1]CAF1031668.1 unnamed protein product [Rotaria sp. Silwood1]CAF3424806.1 unnamed protein product [Rotaria sp. Silwood1]CAF4606284.1 unnamed protein product [Rotaria sp. Silwood1]CAF4823603.1 unnamed protein product [Rotaria sp. Silwood1]